MFIAQQQQSMQSHHMSQSQNSFASSSQPQQKIQSPTTTTKQYNSLPGNSPILKQQLHNGQVMSMPKGQIDSLMRSEEIDLFHNEIQNNGSSVKIYKSLRDQCHVIPNISVITSNENQSAFRMKRMVSNILDYSPTAKRKKDIKKEKAQQEQVILKNPNTKSLRQLKSQLRELFRFTVQICILLPITMIQRIYQNSKQTSQNESQYNLYDGEYLSWLNYWHLIFYCFAIVSYFIFLNMKLLTSKRVLKLRMKMQSLEDDSALFNYLNQTIFQLCKFIAMITCRRQLAMDLKMSYKLSYSNNSDDQESYFFGQRSEQLKLMTKNQLMKTHAQMSSSHKINQCVNSSTYFESDNITDEDRFNTILEGGKQNQKSTGSLKMKIKTQEENIKSYFGLGTKPVVQNNSLILKPNHSGQFNNDNQNMNSDNFKEMRLTPICNNLQIPEMRSKNRSLESSIVQSNNDGFEGISIQALSTMKFSQTHSQVQNLQQQVMSPARRYLEDRISEKNEDEHSQVSITQESEQDSHFFENIQNETPKPTYNIHINDQLIQSSFTNPTPSHTVKLNTSSLSLINNLGNFPGNTNGRKSFKRMQLRDIQKFHSQDHGETSLLSLNKIINKAQIDVKDGRRSTIIPGSQVFPHQNKTQNLQNDPFKRSNNKISTFCPNTHINKTSNQIIGDNTDQESYRSSMIASSPTFTHNSKLEHAESNLFQKRQASEVHNQNEKANQEELQEIEEYQLTLDTFGSLFMLGAYFIILSIRQQYLELNFPFQLAVYRTISINAQKLIRNTQIHYCLYILLFCSLQHPSHSSITNWEFYSHVLLNALFIISITFLDQQPVKTNQNLQPNKIDKIQQIIKSDSHLKNLVQLIPYGIAVLNLDDVSHFNNPFGKVLGVKKQEQVQQALNKFQRKIKVEDQQRVQNNNSNNLNINQSQKSGKNKKVTFTNLKEDLEYILNNKDLAFKETNNIFDIYFIDKDDQMSTRQNSQRSPRPRSAISSVSATQLESVNSNISSARKVYSISISPISWGEKECLLLTVKDITHEKIIDQKQLMDRLKNMIFKSFSHELKTPLNGIIMSLETSNFISKAMLTKLRNERQRSVISVEDVTNQSQHLRLQLKIMESCSYVLKNIMHDFFDYNQLQTGELTLNVKEFELNQFIKDVSRIVKHQMKFDKVKFKTKIEFQNSGGFLAEQKFDTKNIKMTCDRDRLQQILLNLLMNSIKFTNKGFIELQIYVKQLNNPQVAKFKVKDSGLGIEEERLPYIFNLFEKNENQNLGQYLKSKNKSARMGLPISQNLCQMMGGHISVKSKVNQGSTFSFGLPLSPQENLTNRIHDDSMRVNHINDSSKRGDSSNATSKTFEFASVIDGFTPNIENDDFNRTATALMKSISQMDMNHTSITKRQRDQDELSQESYEDSVMPNDEDYLKGSSKDLIFQNNKKLGQFELVFNSPKARNLNLKLTGNVIYEEEEKSTPKLLHSSTKIDVFPQQNPSDFATDRLRRVKTNKMDNNSYSNFNNFQNNQQNQDYNLRDLNNQIELIDNYTSHLSSSLKSEILEDDTRKNEQTAQNKKRNINFQIEEEIKEPLTNSDIERFDSNQHASIHSYMKLRDANFSFNQLNQGSNILKKARNAQNQEQITNRGKQNNDEFLDNILLKPENTTQFSSLVQKMNIQKTQEDADTDQHLQIQPQKVAQGPNQKLKHEFSFQIQKSMFTSNDSFNPRRQQQQIMLNTSNNQGQLKLGSNEGLEVQKRSYPPLQHGIRKTANFDQLEVEEPSVDTPNMQRILQRNSSKNVMDKIQRINSQQEMSLRFKDEQMLRDLGFDDGFDECIIDSERVNHDTNLRAFLTNPGKSLFGIDSQQDLKPQWHHRSISDDPTVRLNFNFARESMLNFQNRQGEVMRLVNDQDDLDSPSLNESNIQSIYAMQDNIVIEEASQRLSQEGGNSNSQKNSNSSPYSHGSFKPSLIQFTHQDSIKSQGRFKSSNSSGGLLNQNDGSSTKHAFLDPSNFMMFRPQVNNSQKEEIKEQQFPIQQQQIQSKAQQLGIPPLSLTDIKSESQKKKKILFKLDSFQSFAAGSSSKKISQDISAENNEANGDPNQMVQGNSKNSFSFSFLASSQQQINSKGQISSFEDQSQNEELKRNSKRNDDIRKYSIQPQQNLALDSAVNLQQSNYAQIFSQQQQKNKDSSNNSQDSGATLKILRKQKENDEMYESPRNSKNKNKHKVVIHSQTLSDNNNSTINDIQNTNLMHHSNTQNDEQLSQATPHICPQVMIVDDVQMNRYAIEQMLLLIFELKVLQAENGQECIDNLTQFYQDKQCSCNGIKLILMDLEMPVMDGITATMRLKRLMSQTTENGRIPEIPIVALTAYLDEKDNCIRAGMKGFSKFLIFRFDAFLYNFSVTNILTLI
eukprot:403357770